MARRPITLWLDDRDHLTLATLHARYKLPTLSETMCLALYTLAQAPEQDYGKASEEAPIRDEVHASTTLEPHACQTELTDTRTELAHTMEELHQLGHENYTLAVGLSDELAQLHAEVGGHIPVGIDPSSRLRYLHAPSPQRRQDAVSLRARARMLRRKEKAM